MRAVPALVPPLGFVFLYAPIVLLVATSFNDSRLVTVWTGSRCAGTRRCGGRQLIEAAWLSLRIAAPRPRATVLGTWPGIALARFGRFRGRGRSRAALAPLVLPDVLVGLSLLLLFVAMEQRFGWPAGRGALTITLAHVSVSLSYVAVVVEARLADAGTELEEAAMDLGASPWRVPADHAAAAWRRRCCPAGCWRSRFRLTTWWSPRSPPDRAPRHCRWWSSPRCAWGSRRS